MPDEEKAVETNEQQATEPAQQEEVTASSQEQQPQPAKESAPEVEPTAEKAEKPKQDEVENRRQAQLRRQREREEAISKARQEEHVSTVIAVLGGKNPFNGEPIEDAEDVAVYETMTRIKADGGDPIADYPKYAKKEATERAKQERLNADAEAARVADLDDFRKEYPDVALDALSKDEDFAEYADGKIGKKPLKEIYRSYLAYKGRHEAVGADKVKNEAAQRAANAQASPGSLASVGAPNSEYYTMDELKKMSKEDIKKNYDKVERSLHQQAANKK